MNNRTNIPTGAAGLILVAVALAPAVLKKCKPAAKVVGASLIKAGQAFEKLSKAN